MGLNMFVLAVLAWPLFEARMQAPFTATLPVTETQPQAWDAPIPSDTSPAGAHTVSPSPTSSPPPLIPFPQASGPAQTVEMEGLVVLALDEGAHTHLFAYQPQRMPLTRLTAGPWQDVTPALSPDGGMLAFSSNRNGYWNLYLLDLKTARTTQLTDRLHYDAAPSWSPDGRWIVYESYNGDDGGLELYILDVAGEQTPIRLTEHPAADHSPAWSPLGRKVAFVSNRSGEPEIWLADLDQVGDDRFLNVSQNDKARESHPAWSPDGRRLAWASVENGYHNLYVWEMDENAEELPRPRSVGSGDWPAWSPDGSSLLTTILAPNQVYLSAYSTTTAGLVLPPLALPAFVSGLSWGTASPSMSLPETFSQSARITPQPLWLPAITPAADIPGGRRKVVPLEDVAAPQPLLHDMVDESFQALRANLARDIGWDFLATLENAYVPLTSPLGPGMKNDWLYTGRAFAFTTLPFNAGWLVVVREDFTPDTYWRIYLRVRFQDGSAGAPLHDQPWDFNTRYSGNTSAYEQGGVLSQAIPPGYWLDFTRYASRYGWERLPALSMWRTSFASARFNEFAYTGGLDWRAAMLELYPPEALVTPTSIVPPTRTLTPTPRWYQTPTPSLTPTPRPTLTPLPPTTAAGTAAPTGAPEPGLTPRPTSTRAPS